MAGGNCGSPMCPQEFDEYPAWLGISFVFSLQIANILF
jgi:hypothetical protein